MSDAIYNVAKVLHSQLILLFQPWINYAQGDLDLVANVEILGFRHLEF